MKCPIKKLPKKKWIDVSFSCLGDNVIQDIFNLYTISYKEIGIKVGTISKMKEKYKLTMLGDLDNDPKPDAFIIYKVTSHGKKIALIGSDGKKESKTFLIEKILLLFRKKGYYGEASHKVEQILEKNGIFPILDEKIVRKVLDDKSITWLNDGGRYSRRMEGLSHPVIKKLYGKPSIS